MNNRKAAVGTLKRPADDKIVQMETLAGDIQNVERFSEFGFASKPPVGSEGIVLTPLTSNSRKIATAIGGQSASKPQLGDGEAAVYSDKGARLIVNNEARITGSLAKIETSGANIIINNGLSSAAKAEPVIVELTDILARLVKIETAVNSIVANALTVGKPAPTAPIASPTVKI